MTQLFSLPFIGKKCYSLKEQGGKKKKEKKYCNYLYIYEMESICKNIFR